MSRCRLLALGLAPIIVGLIASPAQATRYSLGDRPLGQGTHGHDVRVLQDFLTRVGVRTPIDGQYGPLTSRRVRSWQRHSDRRVNGRVSRSDARKLRSQVAAGVSVVAPNPATPPGANATEAARIGPDGKAIAPDSAPQTVKDVIAAANLIVGKHYRRGGGHTRWAINDTGVDCSGATSWALHGGGLLDAPVPSGTLMNWKERGEGQWITVYANPDHVYLVIAQLRVDTGFNDGADGPRWSTEMRPSDAFTPRHPEGL